MKAINNNPVYFRYILRVLLVVIIGSFFSGCIHISVDKNPADKKVDLVLDKTFQTEEGKILNVGIKAGDVKLNSWDKKEVQVKIFANSKAKEKYEFEVNKDNDEINVRVNGKGSFLNWMSNTIIDVEVNLPQKMNANISTSGGDISVTNLEGTINLSTSGGDIRLLNIKGSGSLSTSGGDIKINEFFGSLNGSTSGGDINVTNFEGDVTLSTSGGDIRLIGKNGKVKASTSGGDVKLDYSGANKGIQLNTSGGDINVIVDKEFAGKAELKTFGGEVKCLLPISILEKKASKIVGNINDGSNPLECTTMGGDIIVKSR